jgi:NADPH:quinone reductase-like Zn-dependent oxidoreductase
MDMTVEALSGVDFEVGRNDLRQTRLVRGSIDAEAAAQAGKAVLALDHFALTANNITYAAFGDQMSYWNFFPAADGYGRIPVWGFADVVASGVEGLAVGERVFGYFPMSSHLVVEPGRLSPKRFVDQSAHRQGLSPVYNTYERVSGDPAYAPAQEAAQMILRPLVMTSYLIADFFEDNTFFGARQVLVISASSKTSLGLAFCLKRLAAAGISVIGLTSARNKAFVEGTGYYDKVVTYDAVSSLDASIPTAYVDMAGSVDLLKQIHGHFGEQIVYACRVGGTHWEDLAGRLELPGARPKFFFAPDQIAKRHKDWGPGGLEQRFAGVWGGLLGSVDSWLKVRRVKGPEAVEAAYRDTLEGRVPPEEGLVLSLAT